MSIPLSRPDITELEKEHVLEVLNTPYLSLGPRLTEFEEKFARYIGTKYAVAVNSGTSGLHLVVKALGLEEGDEVLTTPFSFVASANCLLYERVKPVFVDIDKKTWNMDIDKLRREVKKRKSRSKALKGILAVHIFGRPCEIREIMELAADYELCVIEDACEALGAEIRWKGRRRKAGTFGDGAVFGFYPNKQVTTGEGGIILTNQKRLFSLCRSLRNQGRPDNADWLQHERLGYNYRISDINCALGIAQLERIEEILAKREKVALLYNQYLAGTDEVLPPPLEADKKISWFVYVVGLNDSFSRTERDRVIQKLKEKGIHCGNYFSPIHLQPFYRKMFGYAKGDYPITESVAERTLALPFYNSLGEEDIQYICQSLKKALESLPRKH